MSGKAGQAPFESNRNRALDEDRQGRGLLTQEELLRERVELIALMGNVGAELGGASDVARKLARAEQDLADFLDARGTPT